MPALTMNGENLNFIDSGAGTPVVFIHGGCGGGGQWKALAADLSADYRTIQLDLPGCGESMAWREDWTDPLSIDTSAILAVLDHLVEPAHLVAHSGGCLPAWASMQARGDAVLSATMFEPTFYHILRQTGDPTWEEAEDFRIQCQTSVRSGDLEPAMATFVDRWARRAGAWDEMAEPVRCFMRKGADKLAHQWALNHVEAPSPGDLAAAPHPLLFFCGAETIACQRRVLELIDEGPRGPVVWIEGAGHMSPFTHAAFVAPHVRAHLAAAARA